MWTASWQAGFRRSDRFGRLRSYVRPLVRHRTAGPDDIRQPWSLSLRRAWELVTDVGVSWAFVATVSFIICGRPLGKRVFDGLIALVGCGHMSGLWCGIGPLALMIFDSPGPYHCGELGSS